MKNRIKEIRKDQGLTQIEFGEKLGLKGNTITTYENGTRVPSEAAIVAICRTYSINRKWLETGEGEMYVESDQAMIDRIVARYNGSDVFRAILEVYITLPEDKQRAVEEFVARLLDYKEKGIPTDTLSVDDLPRPAEQARPGSAQAE